MTVEELIWELQQMPYDAVVVDESEVNTINRVGMFIASDGQKRVCVEHS